MTIFLFKAIGRITTALEIDNLWYRTQQEELLVVCLIHILLIIIIDITS